ncbi:MAG TPA: PEP-CTERM sorting domain-containing protein [Geobacteraceae bacterium]
MKLLRIFIVAICVVLGSMGAAHAVSLYVDAAPNAYGSPDYAGWWNNAKSSVDSGSFINMQHSANSANAGTTNFEMQDAVVYSFGDLGKRLHFIYWLPGETIDSLQGRFAISMDYVWDGVTHDFYREYYGETWLEPTRWENYNGGVIGTAGFAWWGAYDTNTQAELDSNLAEWDPLQGNIIMHVRLDGEISTITAYHPAPVPEPSTAALIGAGLGALLFWRRKQQG